MNYLLPSSPDLLDLSCRPHRATVPTVLVRKPARLASSLPLTPESPRKFTIGTFMPLPSISASPVCTPTVSVSPQNSLPRDSPIKNREIYTTAPNSPFLPPPTWIATPPTPPPKMVRRSITQVQRSRSPISPSASFPASTLPQLDNESRLKRSNSSPTLLAGRLSFDPFPHAAMYSRNLSTEYIPFFDPPMLYSPTIIGSSSSGHATSAKTLFHVQNDFSADAEDFSHQLPPSPERTTTSCCSDNDSDDSWQAQKTKNDIRIYHALKEILDTEFRYLLDLRALVTVYLRILPTLTWRLPPTAFGRTSASFTSSPWINSYSHIQAAALSASSGAISEASGVPNMATKDLSKTSRYLFTNQEVEALTRNAEEILQHHEQFVRDLRMDLAPLGFVMDDCSSSNNFTRDQQSYELQNTSAAIRIISAKFVTEASRFASYQAFCAGHPEALDIVRKVALQRPLEWDAFEQRCSTLVSELEPCPTLDSDLTESPPSEEIQSGSESPCTVEPKNRSRAVSLSSIEGAARASRFRASRDGVEGRRERSSSRLTFIDYMIKPVQRICKYPLILEQLKPSRSVCARSPAYGAIVDDINKATLAMKHVASAVDEARRRQDIAIKSALIVSRISLTCPAVVQMSTLFPECQTMTQGFLSSLGTCLLAGSLDVMYHPPKPSSSSIIAKYLGAFLYPGGYLVLVKVSKGKLYEPKHWFSLAEFDIRDLDDDDAMLPYSIRLVGKGHWFELAAACEREKEAWLDSLQEARNQKPTWINEPTPSLRFDDKRDFIPSTPDDGTFELDKALPGIQSISDAGKTTDYAGFETLANGFGAEFRIRRTLRQESSWRQPEPEPPSRRSSTASMKAIFAPDSDSIVIRRSAPPSRSRVDFGLQDVISQLCLSARSHATFKDEELFPPPKPSRRVFVRSQSGLSMAGMAAKSRLTKHESVRILRRRSLLDKIEVTPNKILSSKQSLRQSKALSISSEPDHQRPTSIGPPGTPPSPLTASHPLKSPNRISFFPSNSINSSQSTPESKPLMKTSRSSRSFKELFQLRSSPSSAETPGSKTRTSNSIRRWTTIGAIHRRTQSVPNAPEKSATLPDIHPKLPPMDLPTFDIPTLDFGNSISFTVSPVEPRVTSQSTGRLTTDDDKFAQRSSLHSRSQSFRDNDNHGLSKRLSIFRRWKP